MGEIDKTERLDDNIPDFSVELRGCINTSTRVSKQRGVR